MSERERERERERREREKRERGELYLLSTKHNLFNPKVRWQHQEAKKLDLEIQVTY